MIVHVITMVPSALPKTDLELKASRLIQQIREILKTNGGDPILPILMGDATLFESVALDPYIGPFDILVTKHVSVNAYNRAIKTDEYQRVTRNQRVFTFGFNNSGLYHEWVLPTMKQVHSLVGPQVDIHSKLFVQSGGKVDFSLYQANGDSGLENYKRRVGHYPNRAFYLVELCTKKETPDGKADDIEFSTGWQNALFTANVQTLFGGKVVSLDGGPKTFREVNIYKFSTREAFVDMMESDHYVELLQIQDRFILDRFVELCLPIY
eukprot:Nitzschia sp. Nitz4//scaffold234_size30613//8787//9584//NITZ4_007960-RA/size30613-est2genome-gene-0.49-mRNA-1//-1//CDS//3329543407//2950//frame0